MVSHVKASMSAVDVSTFTGMFNNGSVDAAKFLPVVYKALELYKGVGKKGGVIRFPLAQMTLQLFVHSEKFLKALVKNLEVIQELCAHSKRSLEQKRISTRHSG